MSEVINESAQFDSDGFIIRAHISHSSGLAQRATVIVLHEWWGLTDHIKDVAKRFAQSGYFAIAPDLYSRVGNQVTNDPEEATKLMNLLTSQSVLRDLNKTVSFLKNMEDVDPHKIGVVGFSMGATFSLMIASHNSDIRAVVPFYGKVPPIETLNYLVCPVLYHYGGKDNWVTRQEVDRLKSGFTQFGKEGNVYIYPESQHGFFNDARPKAYNDTDAKQAWQRTIQFLEGCLR